MKFKINESRSWDDDFEPVYEVKMKDLDLGPWEVLKRYVEEKIGLEEARKLWLEEVYPKIDQDYQEDIDTYPSLEDFVTGLDGYELANDFYDFGVFDDDEVEEIFQDLYNDEIEDYLSEPTTQEVHDEWERDYREMTMPKR